MHRGFGDDGPKLREEKQFEDFYSDLHKETLLPILLPQDPSPHPSAERNEDALEQRKVPMKQLIFNGQSTLEPIRLHRNRTKFKKCSIPIPRLDTIKQQISKADRKNTKAKKEASLSKFNEVRTPYMTKFSTTNQDGEKGPLIQEKFKNISKNLAGFKTEYDMDEQDDLYLQFLNEEYCEAKMTHIMFEIIMSVLEREWSHLEKQIPPKSTLLDPSSLDHRSATTRLHYHLFGSDDGTEQSVDQTCAVCGGGDSDNANAIVFCDGCDIAVHQECYGIVFIPEGQWLCRRCLVSKNRKVSCLFCPSHTGAFKQTDTGSWAHVICGLWIPELFFANLHYMEPIEGVENISKSRWKLVCSICKQRMGACVQCTNKNCFTAFHVTCAKRAGLYMDFGGASIIEVASNQLHPPHALACFCERHSPPGWPDLTEGIRKTRRYFTEYNDNEVSQNLNMKHSSMSIPGAALHKNKWKTNRGTPIAPHLFAEIVHAVAKLLNLPKCQQVAYHICKYWSMKRELKRGAPLVRKYDLNSSNMLDDNQLQERLAVTDILLDDLQRLKELTILVRRRTYTQNELQRTARKIKYLTQFPDRYITKLAIVDKFVTSEPFRNLERLITDESVLSALSSCKEYDIDSPKCFQDQVSAIFTSLEMSPLTNRAVQSNVRKARSLLNSLVKECTDVNVVRRLQQDFVIDQKFVKEIRWKGSSLQEMEGLSDVEELTPKEICFLKELL